MFEVLVKADLFLDSLYWRDGGNFDKIYDSAITIAKMLEENAFYRQLLVSKAFLEVAWGEGGKTKQLLSEAKDIETQGPPVSVNDNGKHLCYTGIHQLVTGKIEDGV